MDQENANKGRSPRCRAIVSDAHRTGHPIAAASIVEIADAAEEAWFRAEGARAFAV